MTYGDLALAEEEGKLEAAIEQSCNLLIEAPTGSGKSTQVPKMLLPKLKPGAKILVLQPRRLAARMLAERIASELGEEVGETVGYQTRYERVSSEKTRILFITESRPSSSI